MHLSLKCGNKLCMQRDVENRQRIHRHKMANMRPTSRSNARKNLDNNRPQRQLHLEMALKKRQLANDRFDVIERDNRLLMEKMYHILRKPDKGETREFAPGVRINHNQGPVVDCFMSRRSIMPGAAVQLDSLNRGRRRKAYMQVAAENLSILKRIESRKPNYQRSAWRRQRNETENYLRLIRNDRTSGYLSPSRAGSMRTFSTYKQDAGRLPSAGMNMVLQPHQQQLSYALDDALDDGEPIPLGDTQMEGTEPPAGALVEGGLPAEAQGESEAET